MDIESFVENLAAQFEDLSPAAITAASNFRELPGWSSLVALSVLAMCDEEYGVTLSGNDIRNATTVKDLFDAVVAKRT